MVTSRLCRQLGCFGKNKWNLLVRSKRTENDRRAFLFSLHHFCYLYHWTIIPVKRLVIIITTIKYIKLCDLIFFVGRRWDGKTISRTCTCTKKQYLYICVLIFKDFFLFNLKKLIFSATFSIKKYDMFFLGFRHMIVTGGECAKRNLIKKKERKKKIFFFCGCPYYACSFIFFGFWILWNIY
jgi:hypothetical protein